MAQLTNDVTKQHSSSKMDVVEVGKCWPELLLRDVGDVGRDGNAEGAHRHASNEPPHVQAVHVWAG